ncbi:hypothetical protein Pla22_33600 [Rubripirellula amarantea]|uniref:Uncharacterized protein n=1 Tax=Rubripirellula amarantea TaxID=2527999 RepID=A0A5C5WJ75_9BACT|nr:hypothetical protein Pla22_33600 [Rubripirellula amarantea]
MSLRQMENADFGCVSLHYIAQQLTRLGSLEQVDALAGGLGVGPSKWPQVMQSH